MNNTNFIIHEPADEYHARRMSDDAVLCEEEGCDILLLSL